LIFNGIVLYGRIVNQLIEKLLDYICTINFKSRPSLGIRLMALKSGSLCIIAHATDEGAYESAFTNPSRLSSGARQ